MFYRLVCTEDEGIKVSTHDTRQQALDLMDLNFDQDYSSYWSKHPDVPEVDILDFIYIDGQDMVIYVTNDPQFVEMMTK